MKNKKYLIIVILVIIACVLFFVLNKDNKNANITESNTQENSNLIENIQESQNNTEKNEIEQNSIENVSSENNEENNVEIKSTESDNEIENNNVFEDDNETSQNGKETAIKLAKNKWGASDNSVYYFVEDQRSDDVYIVSVRDNETTETLEEYKVNIKTKKIDKN